MKRTITMAAVLLLAASMSSVSAFAADTADVTVTISDGAGQLVLVQQPVTVTDADNDGALTIGDALYAAHEAAYPGGAAAGFASSVGTWGLSLDKLWGVSNGGSYGYYRNNGSTMSLGDAVADGDTVHAFIYQDLVNWSDVYTFFTEDTADAKAGEALEVTLQSISFGADYSMVTAPLAGAVITVDGQRTDAVTDADGKATVTLADAGKVQISAVSDDKTIVPPVCVVNVAAADVTTTETTAPETTAPAETTSEAPAETTADTTTETTVTTESTQTTQSTKATTATTKATTKAASGATTSPKTGDAAPAGVLAVMGLCAGAFVLTHKHED